METSPPWRKKPAIHPVSVLSGTLLVLGSLHTYLPVMRPAPVPSEYSQGTLQVTLHRSKCYKDGALIRPGGLFGAHLYKPHESLVGSKEEAKEKR